MIKCNFIQTLDYTPREKPQEIKTVRIVKRESERRQRDRDKFSGNVGLALTSVSVKCVPVIEEPDYRVRKILSLTVLLFLFCRCTVFCALL